MAINADALRLQRELRSQLDRVLDAQLRDLTGAWVRAWDEISVDLREVLLELLVAPEITRAKLQRSQRLLAALALIAAELDELADQAQIRILTDLQQIIDTAGGAQASIIDSQLPPNAQQLVDLDAWSRVDRRQVDAIVRRTTEQITSRMRPLSGEAMEVVRRELVRGLVAGSNPRTVARSMVRRAEQGFNGGLTRALNVSRTELLDAHRTAAAAGQEQHADVLTGWMWLATLSPRTCPSCIAMHGTVHDLDEPGPLDHQQGRCTRLPQTKTWTELGFDDMDEPPSLVPDADAWFAGLTPNEQRELLGPKRYAAWATGRFPRSAWATRRESDGWRDSYVPAPAPDTTAVPAVARTPLPDSLEWSEVDTTRPGQDTSDHRLFTRGPHSVHIEPDLDDDQLTGLLDDVAAVFDDARLMLEPYGVMVYVPDADPRFTEKAGLLGYVVRGEQVINLSPRVAPGPVVTDAAYVSLMPAAQAVGIRRYTIAHELGHVVDALRADTLNRRLNVRPEASTFAATVPEGMSVYASSNPTEAYAEAFVEWLLGDGTHEATAAYAEHYGWRRP